MDTDSVTPAPHGGPDTQRGASDPSWLLRRILFFVLLCGCLLIPRSSAWAEDDWEVVVAPYMLLASMDGDAAVGRTGLTSVDADFSTILDYLEIGGMGRFEVSKSQWGFMTDVAYMKLGDDISTVTGGVLDAEVEQFLMEAFLFRRFGSEQTSVDVFGGVRYWDIDIDLELTGPIVNTAISRGEHWADPVFGARVLHHVSDKWFLPLRGDIGGFGVNSDFSWNVQGGVGYNVSDRIAIVVQYRALGVDFSTGTEGTSDFFVYDIVTHGPLIGFAFRF